MVTAVVVVTYRAATSDGVVADKVNVAVGAGGMMAGIVATIVAKIRDSGNNRRHHENATAINGAAERQVEAATELVTAVKGVTERRDEVLTTTLTDVVREVIREELTVARSTAEPNGEAMRDPR